MTKKIDIEWLRREYIDKRRSALDIAAEIGVDNGTIRNHLKKAGISTRNLSESHLHGTIIPDAEWLRVEYVDKRRTTLDIAAEIGVNNVTIRNYLKKAGVSLRSNSEAQLKGKTIPDDEWLRVEYVDKRWTPRDIAAEIGVSEPTILRRLKKAGVSLRSSSEAHLKGKEKPSKEWLYQKYVVEQRDLSYMAAEIGVENKSIARWLREASIESRSSSVARSIEFRRRIDARMARGAELFKRLPPPEQNKEPDE